MSDYTKTTNFAAKDALATGNPSKLILGAELDTEFNNIATASATKANKIASPTANNVLIQDASGDLADSGIAYTALATLAGTETLTNKTLTAPVLSGTITGTYTLAGTPTLASPVMSGTITGTYTIGGTPTFPSSVATLTGTQTLTNKTLTAVGVTTPTSSSSWTITSTPYVLPAGIYMLSAATSFGIGTHDGSSWHDSAVYAAGCVVASDGVHTRLFVSSGSVTVYYLKF